ncbi:MAG: hypothetical protein AAGK97_15545, partial [Bacteroidota bacterium]
NTPFLGNGNRLGNTRSFLLLLFVLLLIQMQGLAHTSYSFHSNCFLPNQEFSVSTHTGLGNEAALNMDDYLIGLSYLPQLNLGSWINMQDPLMINTISPAGHTIWFLAMGTLLILMIGMYLHFKRKMGLLEEAVYTQKNLMDHKNQELIDRLKDQKEKANMLSSIHAIIDSEVNPTKAHFEIKKLFGARISRDIEWMEFKQNFDNRYPEFLKFLKQRHPSISQNELWLCAYLKLGYNNRKISDLMQVSIRTIESRKYRLKKKLSLEKEMELISYLGSFTH